MTIEPRPVSIVLEDEEGFKLLRRELRDSLWSKQLPKASDHLVPSWDDDIMCFDP